MEGIGAKYPELLRVSVEQPFYTNKYCKKYTVEPDPDFLLTPSAECLAIMKKLDYTYRNTPENAGIIILSRAMGQNGGGDDLVRFAPGENDKLCFWVSLKNPSAINFDQLPVQIDSTKIFYFSNLINDPGVLRTRLHLTASASGADETVDRVVKKTIFYQYQHSATVALGAAVVKHTLTGIEIEAKTIVNQASTADLYFDLSPLPQGNCKLFINHIEEDAFYYMGTEPPSQVFGVIELLLSPALNANYRIIEPDRSLTKNRPYYVLPLINRSTLWRFTLELSDRSPLFLEMDALAAPDQTDFKNRLNIITNDTALTFTQTSASPDGKRFQFTVNSAVALQEKYISSSSVTKDTLNLVLKKYVGVPAKEAVVKSDLQCPSTGSIDATNNPVIYSDILLTI